MRTQRATDESSLTFGANNRPSVSSLSSYPSGLPPCGSGQVACEAGLARSSPNSYELRSTASSVGDASSSAFELDSSGEASNPALSRATRPLENCHVPHVGADEVMSAKAAQVLDRMAEP